MAYVCLRLQQNAMDDTALCWSVQKIDDLVIIYTHASLKEFRGSCKKQALLFISRYSLAGAYYKVIRRMSRCMFHADKDDIISEQNRKVKYCSYL